MKLRSLDRESREHDESSSAGLFERVNAMGEILDDAAMGEHPAPGFILPGFLDQDQIQAWFIAAQPLGKRGETRIDLVGPIDPERRHAPEIGRRHANRTASQVGPGRAQPIDSGLSGSPFGTSANRDEQDADEEWECSEKPGTVSVARGAP
jgi:hypothetical protein